MQAASKTDVLTPRSKTQLVVGCKLTKCKSLRLQALKCLQYAGIGSEALLSEVPGAYSVIYQLPGLVISATTVPGVSFSLLQSNRLKSAGTG